MTITSYYERLEDEVTLRLRNTKNPIVVYKIVDPKITTAFDDPIIKWNTNPDISNYTTEKLYGHEITYEQAGRGLYVVQEKPKECHECEKYCNKCPKMFTSDYLESRQCRNKLNKVLACVTYPENIIAARHRIYSRRDLYFMITCTRLTILGILGEDNTNNRLALSPSIYNK